MTTDKNIFYRVFAALVAVTMTVALLAGYFVTPEAQTVSGMLV